MGCVCGGTMMQDYEVGGGLQPLDGQQVVFHYTAYNESGATIDSTYRKDRPAETRLGIGGMIPGFEEGIKSMKAGGKRRIVVPPELGPPVLTSYAWLHPGGVQGWRACVHTPSRVAPPAGRHQLNTARQLHLLPPPATPLSRKRSARTLGRPAPPPALNPAVLCV